MKALLPAMLSASLLASCQKDGRDGGESVVEKAEPARPWDWIPEDSTLLAGRAIYLAECSLCHNEGEESSPALTRKDEWETRAAKGEPTLISHAINGFRGTDGKMPARGGTGTLTDAQVSAAVRYILATPK